MYITFICIECAVDNNNAGIFSLYYNAAHKGIKGEQSESRESELTEYGIL